MGEAAGVATAISLADDVSPRTINVKALQSELIATGCNLGQGMREINGIAEAAVLHEEKYPNPEYKEKTTVIVKNRTSEFTGK
jgi:hypothetical protein